MYHDTCTCLSLYYVNHYNYDTHMYLYNMESVSSTGDRDIQPAAVDDWPQEPARRLRTPVHV